MFASPASTTRQDLERVDAHLERVERARRVVRLADRARPEARAGTVADRVVERRPDDRHVGTAPPDLGGIRHPRQLLERGRPDVRGQVEVLEDRVLPVPAVAGGKRHRAPSPPRVVGHWPLTRRAGTRPTPQSTSDGSANRSNCRLGDDRGRGDHHVVRARRRGGRPELDRVHRRAALADRHLGVDRRQDLADVAHIGAAEQVVGRILLDAAGGEVRREPVAEHAVGAHRRRAAGEDGLALAAGRGRGRLHEFVEAPLHRLEVALVGAADHEPADRPGGNDVRCGAALEDDSVRRAPTA